MITNDVLNYGEDPQGRIRFYGIYAAIVAPGVDPLGKNRLLLQISMPTGVEVSNWAEGCLPVTSNSYHPDHLPHTAAQIAALLTTTAVGITDSASNTATVPALTVVAKPGGGQLNHAHRLPAEVINATVKETIQVSGKSSVVKNAPTSKTDVNEKGLYTTASGLYAPGTTSADTSIKIPEHTFHRNLPAVGQKVWVMFVAGDPEFPVWIGVQA
jgi:hypothetical protein